MQAFRHTYNLINISPTYVYLFRPYGVHLTLNLSMRLTPVCNEFLSFSFVIYLLTLGQQLNSTGGYYRYR